MNSQLDEHIARVFFACNIPFNVASHPKFKNTIEQLRPGYTPPSRKPLSGELLDRVHGNIREQVKADLQGKGVTLLQDGRSDIHNSPVIASSLHCEGKAYFLSAIGTNKKTAAYSTALQLLRNP